LSEEPSSVFAGLSRGCIRDEYVSDDNMVRDGVLFTFLGVACSVLTVYVLSVLGFFV
jgi:hypothetical protein